MMYMQHREAIVSKLSWLARQGIRILILVTIIFSVIEFIPFQKVNEGQYVYELVLEAPTELSLPKDFANPSPVPDDWKTYENKNLGFRLRYPDHLNQFTYYDIAGFSTEPFMKDSDSEWNVWFENHRDFHVSFGPQDILAKPFSILIVKNRNLSYPDIEPLKQVNTGDMKRELVSVEPYLVGSVEGRLRLIRDAKAPYEVTSYAFYVRNTCNKLMVFFNGHVLSEGFPETLTDEYVMLISSLELFEHDCNTYN